MMRKVKFLVFVFFLCSCLALSVNSVSAAEKSSPYINVTKKVIYVATANGYGASVGTYQFLLKNTVKNWKDLWTVEWLSSDNKIATVNKSGLVKAKKVGKAVVTCNIYDKGTKKLLYKLSSDITIKDNAASIQIVNSEESRDVIMVGEKVVLKSKAVGTAGGASTDTVYWYIDEFSSNTAGAEVDQKGVLTTKRTGEFYIIARTAQSGEHNRNQEWTAISECYRILVDSPLEVEIEFGDCQYLSNNAIKALSNGGYVISVGVGLENRGDGIIRKYDNKNNMLWELKGTATPYEIGGEGWRDNYNFTIEFLDEMENGDIIFAGSTRGVVDFGGESKLYPVSSIITGKIDGATGKLIWFDIYGIEECIFFREAMTVQDESEVIVLYSKSGLYCFSVYDAQTGEKKKRKEQDYKPLVEYESECKFLTTECFVTDTTTFNQYCINSDGTFKFYGNMPRLIMIGKVKDVLVFKSIDSPEIVYVNEKTKKKSVVNTNLYFFGSSQSDLTDRFWLLVMILNP